MMSLSLLQENSPALISGTDKAIWSQKNRKVITDRDFYNKKPDTEISTVKLTTKKKFKERGEISESSSEGH